MEDDGEMVTEVITAEGNTTVYRDNFHANGGFTGTITDPAGDMTVISTSADGLTHVKTLACGTKMSMIDQLDFRFRYPEQKSMAITTPAGLSRQIQNETLYTIDAEDNTISTVTKNITVNGKTGTLVHDIDQSQKILTSPQGRTASLFYDPASLLPETRHVEGLFDTLMPGAGWLPG